MKRIWKLCLSLVLICSVFLLSACDNTPKSGLDEGKVYGVSFVTGVEGLEVDAQVIDEGGKVLVPDVPLRPGYKFIGWKVEDQFWDFEVDKVFSSFEMFAVWEKDEDSWDYTEGLTFLYNSDTDSYEVSGYVGTSDEVVVPIYYSGEKGGKIVSKVGDSAFAGNSVIKKIVLGCAIGTSCFAGSSVEEVEFNKSVDISDSAFSGTANLSKVTFLDSQGEIKIGTSAFAGSGIETLVIPDNVTQIGASAFAGSSLKVVKIGSLSKLNKIGASAFYNTKIIDIILPDSLKVLADGVFAYNQLLESVVFPSGVTSVGKGIFANCNSLVGIYYSGSEKPEAVALNKEWKGSSCLEYLFSSADMGIPGYWKGFGMDGRPIVTQNIVDIKINFDAIKEYLPESYENYTVVFDCFYPIFEHTYGFETKTSLLDEKWVATVQMDEYKIQNFSLRVYSNSAENFNETELAVMLFYDIDITNQTSVASGFDPETKMIIFN